MDLSSHGNGLPNQKWLWSKTFYLSRLLAKLTIVCLASFSLAHHAFGYAVLSHLAIIDAEWSDHIRPVLLARYPDATPAQLQEAQAYAYGGSTIQDMGYYPFGGRLFSHLTHYVRSGDFVQALLNESSNLNEYAFALGALSHYVADIEGHSIAVNRSVALLYPGLHRRYGNSITWEESPWAHSLTEFGFDTLEVVARHYAPMAYHRWIGFKVAKPLLQRAFEKTYGLKLNDVMLLPRLALFSYRELAGKGIPEMSEVTWALRKKQLEALAHGAEHQHLYHLSRTSYEAWRNTYTKPGPGDRVEALLFRLVPSVGPLCVIQFHAPTLQTQKLFADSLQVTVQKYDSKLRALEAGNADPPDINLDTGRQVRPGEYVHCDLAYAELLHKLDQRHFTGISPELRVDLLDFFDHSGNNSMKAKPRKWRKVQREVERLRAAAASPESSRGKSAEAQPPKVVADPR